MSGMEQDGGNLPSNPLEPAAQLKDPSESGSLDKSVHPQQAQCTEDSAVTKAEKYERHGVEVAVEDSPAEKIKLENATEYEKQNPNSVGGDVEGSPPKRIKLENVVKNEEQGPTQSERQRGVAPIKEE